MIRPRSSAVNADAGIADGELHAVVDLPADDGKLSAFRHGVAAVADQVAERDPELIARRPARGGRPVGTVDRHRMRSDRVDSPVPRAHWVDGDRPQIGHGNLGEVRQRRDDVVGQLDVPLDPPKVLGLLLAGVGLRALSR